MGFGLALLVSSLVIAADTQTYVPVKVQPGEGRIQFQSKRDRHIDAILPPKKTQFADMPEMPFGVGDPFEAAPSALQAEDVPGLEKAANQGDSDAQVKLGLAYYHGRGVAQNFAEAVRWYKKAADQGDGKHEDETVH